MTKLYIVRHGQTDWNAQELLQGQSDIPLNTIGLDQAERVGKYFQNTPIDAIYTSPLIRAHQTATAIHQYHEAIPLYTDKLLMEQFFGIAEGKPIPDLHVEYPHLVWQSLWKNPSYKAPDGESVLDVLSRIETFLTATLEKEKGKTIVFVSHGIAIRCLFHRLLMMPLIEMATLSTGNTSVSCINIPDDDIAQLEFLDYTDHLL